MNNRLYVCQEVSEDMPELDLQERWYLYSSDESDDMPLSDIVFKSEKAAQLFALWLEFNGMSEEFWQTMRRSEVSAISLH